MKKIILFAATVCMAACQNTPKTPAIDLTNLDPSVAPNEDFYQYATGGWQKLNPLKPEYSRYGSFDVLRDNNEKRINELFAGMTKQQAAPGSVEQKRSPTARSSRPPSPGCTPPPAIRSSASAWRPT